MGHIRGISLGSFNRRTDMDRALSDSHQLAETCPTRRPSGPPNRTTNWLIVGGIAAVFGVVVVVVLVVLISRDSSESATASSSGVSGGLDDWIAAICEPGTLRER